VRCLFCQITHFNSSVENSRDYCANLHLSYIYLGYFVCVCVCVCVSQFVAERSGILLVIIIKLTKAARRRVWRGRDRDGEIEKRQIVEGGCEETFHCLILTKEK
jgi:hypothetical protein